MSTSDAAERRSEGRETEPPFTAERARTATARKQVETLSDAGLSTEQSSTEKHTIQTKTHLSLNLGRRPNEKAESILLDTSTKSFHGPFPACSKNIVYRVHDLAVHAVDKIPLPLKTVKETKNCISIETSSRIIQSFPNGLRGPYHTNASRCEEPAKRANSLDLNVDKARAEELSGHSAMLSSTVVTVMAPHWSGRLRRSKREGMSDFQGNLQTRTEISSDVERMLSSGLQSQHHMLDDSVFYSPKPPRQRDSSSSPCELGEISLVSSRRNRASTGPPSAGPVTGEERMSHSYADLKYGIEPGRSFSLSSWSAGKSSSNPAWGQSVDIVDIPWDTEAPPTPPPTPPLSPVTRRMSKPRCLSPPSLSGRSDSPQDGQCPRGHLPSRGYLSSLSTFEESSDSSSDTTTDDEYYLETGEDEEKETEL
uniref:Uncharacterized protein n=1 Tax=Knipowitschia caucasica TaxID=637954 RepID=A0AAV2L7Z7_KNICA